MRVTLAGRAVKSGQFDDIERPKHRMMDDDS
jgi:cbb3-type cytochrome oxidase maturation protein